MKNFFYIALFSALLFTSCSVNNSDPNNNPADDPSNSIAGTIWDGVDDSGNKHILTLMESTFTVISTWGDSDPDTQNGVYTYIPPVFTATIIGGDNLTIVGNVSGKTMIATDGYYNYTFTRR